jgi:peptide/nickel transport system substrate-binding protein
MRRMIPRLLLSVLVALFAVGLVACGDDDDGGGVTPADFGQPTEPPEDAQQGGTIEVIAAGDVDFIDPGAAYYQFSYMIHDTIHRRVLWWEPDDVERPGPDLAESEPEVSDDNRSVTVTLRDGVRYSPPVDREVRSADVKYAIERGLLPGVANGYIGAYFNELEGFEEAQQAAERNKTIAPDISGIETPDDRTIVFNLDKPVASILVQALGLPLSAPVPEEYAKEFDAENPSTYGEHQVATGPYMIENDEEGELTGYDPGKEIHLVRNPNWDEETDVRPAYVDEIFVREGFDDVNSASRKILEGESQVSGDIVPTPAALKLAATEFPDQLTLAEGAGNRYVALNTTIPPFDDLNVRRAVLAGFDREALRLARGGELAGDIANHFLIPEIPGFEEAGGFEGPGFDFLADPQGDPELAAEYFRKAGFEGGKYEGDEKLLMIGENAGVDQKQAEVALDQFEQLGFDIEFRQVSPDLMYTKFCNVPRAEVAICPSVGWLKDFTDPQVMLDPVFNGNNILPSNNSNWPQLDVPEINRAMEEAKLINDPEERAQAWAEIDEMVTAQAPAVIFLWDTQPSLHSANVNVVSSKYNSITDLNYTSLDQGQ